MDADGRIIPMVEGDQGEGIKDPLDIDDLKELQNYEKEAETRFEKLALEQLDPESLTPETLEKFRDDLLEKTPQPQPQRMKMQLGMPINFCGYQYKVIKVLNRGRVMLKLLGSIPKGRK